MATDDRPLSPHLQVYRPQLTSVMSIFHRLTGIALAIGSLLLVWWLVAAASGPSSFAAVQSFIGSIIGQLMLFGWTFALLYHLCNGIRHLVWDTGRGFEIPTAYATGWIVVASATVLTILVWVAGYSALGG